LNKTKLAIALVQASELKEQCGLLSILKMTLNDPPILQKSIGAFVIPKIDAFARVAYNISCPGIGCWSVSNEFLEVGDVVWRD